MTKLGREGSDGGNRIGVLLCSTQHLGPIMVEAGLALDVGLYFGRRNDLGGAGQGRSMRGWRHLLKAIEEAYCRL